MLVVRATKKLLDRLGAVTLQPGETSTTRMGDWYATVWAWNHRSRCSSAKRRCSLS
jgi:hypothetical protein